MWILYLRIWLFAVLKCILTDYLKLSNIPLKVSSFLFSFDETIADFYEISYHLIQKRKYLTSSWPSMVPGREN